MRLTLLGTGDAAGMPLYGCQCTCCQRARKEPEYRRSSASALLEVNNKRYLLDAGMMDICIQYPAGSLDGIFLTHFHPDHVQGLFHLRWGRADKIPIYCPQDSSGCADLFKHPGILDFQAQHKYKTFEIDELKITPIPLIHSKPTFGYVFEYQSQRIAYLVDTKDVPPRVEELLMSYQLEALVLDTCFAPGVDSRNHNNLNDTLSLHKRLGAKKTIMTHINHDFDLWLDRHRQSLPESVLPGYDGYVVYA